MKNIKQKQQKKIVENTLKKMESSQQQPTTSLTQVCVVICEKKIVKLVKHEKTRMQHVFQLQPRAERKTKQKNLERKTGENNKSITFTCNETTNIFIKFQIKDVQCLWKQFSK